MKNVKVSTAISGIVGLALITMLLIVIAGATLFLVNSRVANEQSAAASLVQAMGEIERDLLQARRSEKDFLLRADEKYVARHGEIMSLAETHFQNARAAAQAFQVVGAKAQFDRILLGIKAPKPADALLIST